MMTPQSPRGFTLVETMVSVMLLTMTIVLPYYAIQRTLSATYSSRDDLIAAALAQEAIEYVRSVRDDNFLAKAAGGSVTWMQGIDGSAFGSRNCLSPNKCTIDATRDTVSQGVVQCTANNCTIPLYINNSTNRYTMDTSNAVPTKFIRYVQLSYPNGANTNEIRVTATVTWFFHGTHTVTVTDVLNNWL